MLQVMLLTAGIFVSPTRWVYLHVTLQSHLAKKTSSALVHVQGQHKVLTPQAVWELVLFNPILNSIVAILLQWLHLS